MPALELAMEIQTQNLKLLLNDNCPSFGATTKCRSVLRVRANHFYGDDCKGKARVFGGHCSDLENETIGSLGACQLSAVCRINLSRCPERKQASELTVGLLSRCFDKREAD